jgi:hypothetical protein
MYTQTTPTHALSVCYLRATNQVAHVTLQLNGTCYAQLPGEATRAGALCLCFDARGLGYSGRRKIRHRQSQPQLATDHNVRSSMHQNPGQPQCTEWHVQRGSSTKAATIAVLAHTESRNTCICSHLLVQMTARPSYISMIMAAATTPTTLQPNKPAAKLISSTPQLLRGTHVLLGMPEAASPTLARVLRFCKILQMLSAPKMPHKLRCAQG